MSANRRRTVVVRCDGSPQIGMGHVMRCLALAGGLRQAGRAVHFVMQEADGRAASLVREHGMAISPCGSGQNGLTLSTEDRRATVDIALREQAMGVLVDHYGADASYLNGLAQNVLLAVIDDLADRDLTAAAWVLNQTLGAEFLPYRLGAACLTAFGPSYALLAPAFAAARSVTERRFSESDNRVLVTFGGGDTTQVTAAVAHALEAVPRRLDVVCILGPHGGSVDEIASCSSHSMRVLGAVQDMAEWMIWADLSINAGGSTCWELCCLGVPMLVAALSADQRLVASGLDHSGCAIRVGEWAGDIAPAELASAVAMLLADPDRRSRMARLGRQLVDGRGAERAARLLIETLEHSHVEAPAGEVEHA